MSATATDVVVIGAGHNGLVAANYLRDAGLEVTVVEAAQHIGGMSSSAATISGAPDHIINHCAVELAFWSAFRPSRDLDLDRYGLRLLSIDPPVAYLDPDGSSLAFWRDTQRTAAEIRRFSRGDAEQYLELSRLLDAMLSVAVPVMGTSPTRPEAHALFGGAGALLRHCRRIPGFVDLALTPAVELIDERFSHPVVRAAMHNWSAMYSSPHHPSSGMGFFFLGFVQRFPFFRPVGGMQALPDALAARLQARGGRIITGAPVAEIDVRAGRVRGVRLTGGKGEITTTAGVLATCDPRQTLVKLLPDDVFSERDGRRVQGIATKNGGHGMLKIDVALSGRVTLPRHNKSRNDGLDLRLPSHLIGSPEGIRRSYGAAEADLLPEADDIAFWNAIPTEVDPSQAPAGADVAYVWTTQVPLEPIGGWEPATEKFTGAVLGRLEHYYSGLEELEIGRRVTTSTDIARDCWVSDGNIMHVDMALNRLGPRRPAVGFGGHSTPIPGLFLGGSGAHPGGGVGGSAGYLAAQSVLRSLKRSAGSGGSYRRRAKRAFSRFD